MPAIEYQLEIGTEVTIIALNCIGTIVGVYLGRSGLQYEVAYFNGGDHVITYLFTFEVHPKKDGTLGFHKG